MVVEDEGEPTFRMEDDNCLEGGGYVVEEEGMQDWEVALFVGILLWAAMRCSWASCCGRLCLHSAF